MTQVAVTEPAPKSEADKLEPLFAPRAIAVVGASRTPGGVGNALMVNLVGGGYAGTQCILAVSKRRQDGRWMGGFMKWDNLNGAVFADSPLVKTRQYFTLGLAVTWTLDKSDKMVEVNDD